MQTQKDQHQNANEAFESLFDEEGYVLDIFLWNPEIAVRIARAHGLNALTKEHWQVVSSVRTRYLRYGVPPLMRNVCRELDIDPNDAHRLFGGCQQVWKIAGLPNPGQEVRAYVA